MPVESWVDWLVGGIVVVVGLAIFYMALREPLDLIFGGIRKMFESVRDRIVGREFVGYDEITYG